jgi:hypothetical protein
MLRTLCIYRTPPTFILRSKSLGDIVTLVSSDDNPSEVVIEGNLVVKGAAVLRRNLDVTSKGGKGLGEYD